ncbi:MAG: hypothetical protein AB1540_11870 [Bdellovibrionota bacterium]
MKKNVNTLRSVLGLLVVSAMLASCAKSEKSVQKDANSSGKTKASSTPIDGPEDSEQLPEVDEQTASNAVPAGSIAQLGARFQGQLGLSEEKTQELRGENQYYYKDDGGCELTTQFLEALTGVGNELSMAQSTQALCKIRQIEDCSLAVELGNEVERLVRQHDFVCGSTNNKRGSQLVSERIIRLSSQYNEIVNQGFVIEKSERALPLEEASSKDVQVNFALTGESEAAALAPKIDDSQEGPKVMPLSSIVAKPILKSSPVQDETEPKIGTVSPKMARRLSVPIEPQKRGQIVVEGPEERIWERFKSWFSSKFTSGSKESQSEQNAAETGPVRGNLRDF